MLRRFMLLTTKQQQQKKYALHLFMSYIIIAVQVITIPFDDLVWLIELNSRRFSKPSFYYS